MLRLGCMYLGKFIGKMSEGRRETDRLVCAPSCLLMGRAALGAIRCKHSAPRWVCTKCKKQKLTYTAVLHLLCRGEEAVDKVEI